MALVGIFGTIALPAVAAPAVGEWTMYGNGPEHNGYYPRTIGAAPFVAGWKKTFTNPVNPVVVSGDKVYGTLSGYFGTGHRAYALDVDDGSERWTFPLDSAYSVNPPAYSNGRVYFQRGNHSGDTHLWCLDAAAGTLKWASPHSAQWENYLAPTIADGGVFVNGGSYGGLYGFDATTGTQRFFVGQGQVDNWTPGYADGVVYSCVNGKFTATNPVAGSQLWTRDLAAASDYYSEGAVPVLADNKAIVRIPGRLVVLDVTTRTQTWFVDGAFSGTPAVADGVVYVLANSVVQAYNLTTGASVGTFATGGTGLSGQPLLTKDLLLVSNSTNTYIFNRSTFALQQVLPTGGALSYAAGRLYIATSSGYSSTSPNSLTTYTVAATEADPAPDLLDPPALPQPKPNPDRTLGPTSTTWLDCTRNGDIAYFLFANPAKIERLNMTTGAWLNAISLPPGPTSFTVAEDRIYVGFGTSVSAFPLDGSTETVLAQTVASISSVMEVGGKLYLAHNNGSKFSVVDATTGRPIASSSINYGLSGLSIARTKNKFFGVTTGVSPSDILQVPINADGSLGASQDSPYHGDYPTGTRTYVMAGEGRVATNAGIIYSTGDLGYLGSLAGAFTDGDFSGSSPVLLRDNTLIGLSASLLETGRKVLTGTPLRIFLANGQINSFTHVSGRGVAFTQTPVADLVPQTPGPAIDPTSLSYTPDAIEFGNGEIVYLLSKLHQSIFRWSVAERRYLSSIPLVETPRHFTYSAANNRLYLAYSTGRISRIDLDSSLSEVNFINSPQAPGGLAAIGEFLFVEDPSGAWATHYIYSNTGVLLSSKDWNYYSAEYIWNATNRKLYFFRDDTSPNDLLWEDVDLEGKLGVKFDSPYHGDYPIKHPLRVSPDGTQVILGSGDVYAGVSLQRLGTIGTSIMDAVWLNGTLVTLSGVTPAGSTTPTSGVLKSWDVAFQNVTSTALPRAPLRMFGISGGLLLVSQQSGRVQFTKVDTALSVGVSDPSYEPLAPIATTSEPSNVLSNGATLSGSANVRGLAGSAYFQYGLTTNYGSSTQPVTLTANSALQPFTQTLSSLAANTTYHYRIVATNADGTTFGEDKTFKTAANKALISTFSANSITASSARISGTASPAGSATTLWVEYGATPAFGQSTTPISLGTASSYVAVNQTLNGLSSGTVYYYRIAAENAGGTVYSGLRSFSTLQDVQPQPQVVTTGAIQIIGDSAVLLGSVTPGGVETYVRFKYWTQSIAALSTAEIYVGAGTTPVPLQVRVAALASGQTYYYQLISSSEGAPMSGSVLQFVTPAGVLQAVDDQVIATSRKKVTIDVLANDIGAPRESLTIVGVRPALAGSVTLNVDRTISYQPTSTPAEYDSFTYQISDGAGHTSTATVVVRNSITGSQGLYHALVGSSESGFDQSGTLSLVFSAKGAFTGTLVLGNEKVPLKGELRADFTATIFAKLSTGHCQVDLSLDALTNQLTGSIVRGPDALTFMASRRVADSDRTVPLAGRYTLLLPAGEDHVAGLGSGYATMMINRLGSTKISGRRNDGVSFSASASIGADGRFPLYSVSGNRSTSSLHGWVSFRDVPGTSDCDGVVGWSHAALDSSVADFPASLTLLGSRYVEPTGTALALDFAPGASNGVLQFGFGENALDPVASTLMPKKLTTSAMTIRQMKLNVRTGIFSGGLMLNDKRSSFSGALFQRQTLAGGVVVRPEGAGWVSLVGATPAAAVHEGGLSLTGSFGSSDSAE